MTIEDILDLYGQDAKFISYKNEELNKKLSKCLYATHIERHFFKPVEFNRKDGLNIVIQSMDMGISTPVKHRLRTTIYFWFIYRRGFHAIRILPESRSSAILYFYTPHFIERYRERGLKDNSIPKPEALNKFICRNHKLVGKKINSEKYPDNFWLCYEEGVAYIVPCFFRKNGIEFSQLTMKTFISWDSMSLKRRNISLSLFQEGVSKGFDIKIPDEILDENDV